MIAGGKFKQVLALIMGHVVSHEHCVRRSLMFCFNTEVEYMMFTQGQLVQPHLLHL